MNRLLICFLLVLITSCTKNDVQPDGRNQKARWIENAFITLKSGKYPRIKAISWWHENFDYSELRIDSSPESLAAYKKGVNDSLFITYAVFENHKLAPQNNIIYHAAFPDFGGTEDIVTTGRINNFETLAGKKIVWAYFSNNWYDSIRFPADEVKVINNSGHVPFIRLMAHSGFNGVGPDPRYTMQRIIDRDFDAELNLWAENAANTNIPLLAEFGTEVNGDWFPWNGSYNGGGTTTGYGDPTLPDGPERFIDAYRHIIDICRANGATNITWFFHVDAYNQPDIAWNSFVNYYPGDDYIDWLGISVYGPQENNDDYQEFGEILQDVYPVLAHLSNKPIAILEFAITEIK